MKLDAFTAAYIVAALWSSTDISTPSGGELLDQVYDLTDIALKRRHCAISSCRAKLAFPQAVESRILSDCWVDLAGICDWSYFCSSSEGASWERFQNLAWDSSVLGSASHKNRGVYCRRVHCALRQWIHQPVRDCLGKRFPGA